MEDKIYFDASKYPKYQEAIDDHLKRLSRVIYLGIAGCILMGIFLAVFTTEMSFPVEMQILLLSVLIIGSIPAIAIGIFMKKRLKKDWQQKPLRISAKGIEFRGMTTSFDDFDRIVEATEVIRGASNDFITLAKGKKAVRSVRKKAICNIDEFVRVIRQLHPEIQIDLH